MEQTTKSTDMALPTFLAEAFVSGRTKKIKVTKCTAYGKVFSNLLPDSEHEVVTPPQGYKNDHSGVWVMGVGEPVKLLTVEFVSL